MEDDHQMDDQTRSIASHLLAIALMSSILKQILYIANIIIINRLYCSSQSQQMLMVLRGYTDEDIFRRFALILSLRPCLTLPAIFA